ncbi:MAG: winged helix-turn-helix transcriptional regulator [Desulfurococcaceae archaeon]
MSKTLTSKVIQFLAENPGATIKDISRALNINQDLARSIVYRLKNRGFVEKSGDGYVVSDKGQWFLREVVRTKQEESRKESVSEVQQQLEKEAGNGKTEVNRFQIITRINELMNRIKSIEDQLMSIKEELESLKKKVDNWKLSERVFTRRLHKPVVSIQEAIGMYGGLLESMRSEGSVIVIGSLAVDREFYEEFRKKFPIPIDEKNRLSEYEQILLEEMIRDARVIVSGGKFYKLIG